MRYLQDDRSRVIVSKLTRKEVHDFLDQYITLCHQEAGPVKWCDYLDTIPLEHKVKLGGVFGLVQFEIMQRIKIECKHEKTDKDKWRIKCLTCHLERRAIDNHDADLSMGWGGIQYEERWG